MSSVVLDEATAAYEAVDALLDKIDSLDCDVLSSDEQQHLLERWQTWRRRLPAGDHNLINQLAEHAASEELSGTLVRVLADRLRISRGEAARRIEEAGSRFRPSKIPNHRNRGSTRPEQKAPTPVVVVAVAPPTAGPTKIGAEVVVPRLDTFEHGLVPGPRHRGAHPIIASKSLATSPAPTCVERP